VESFSIALDGHWEYGIWNKALAWEPEYAQVTRAKPATRNGVWYVTNRFTGPVIEFRRSDVPASRYGRIYWAKDFAAPNGLEYDVTAFAKWYDSVAKWVRRHGKRKPGDRLSPYFLPEAWQTTSETQPRHPTEP